MRYHRRLVESKLRQYSRSFSCTLVTGARQVGKSTVVQELFGGSHQSFVFDPVQDLYGVKQDPDLFLRSNPPPLILDEIQYVPELVPAIYHYRQHSGAEVDLVVEKDGLLFPIEIKARSHVQPSDARSIHTFQSRLGASAGPGLVVYAGSEVLRLTDSCAAAPFDLLPAADAAQVP